MSYERVMHQMLQVRIVPQAQEREAELERGRTK
jgi:hypothetical protein